jgi:hypothetical protein
MNKYSNEDGTILYSPKDIRKANPRIIYWVAFPQGIKKHSKYGVMYTNMLTAYSIKQATKLAHKYNAAYVEKIIQCKLGRWPIAAFVVHKEDWNLTFDELCDKYAKQTEVII